MRAEGCVVEPSQEDAWRDGNFVREFCSGACMCIFWLRPKENLLALASDGFLQNLALEPLRAIRGGQEIWELIAYGEFVARS